MRNLMQLIAALVALATALPAALPARAQTPYPGINATAGVVSTQLLVYAGCQLGRAPEVGIWPLKGDDLPIEDASAIAFYETVFAALNATKPDCVTFVDGAGGSGAIRYFMLVGTGAEARARVDEAFRGVDFVVALNIFDRGGRIQADLKLTDINGATVAAPPAFDVPEDFVATSCAAGAIPMGRAVRTASRYLLERSPDLEALVDLGGRFADTEEMPSFTSYFSRLMVDAITEQSSDLLAGRSVRIADESALAADGTYAFSYQYWPCGDGSATEISAKLRAGDGTTVTWRGKVKLDRLPSWIEVFPAGARPAVETAAVPEGGPAGDPAVAPDAEPDADPAADEGDAAADTTDPGTDPGPQPVARTGSEDGPAGGADAGANDGATDPRPAPEPRAVPAARTEPGDDPAAVPGPEPVARVDPAPRAFYSLSFSPRVARVGDVVSITADIAPACDPFFLDLTEAGAGQVVPLDVFEIEARDDGGNRFRVDTSTPVGLKITPEDTKGVHYVGYVCTPGGQFPEGDVLQEIFGGLSKGTLKRTDAADGPVFWFERYEIQ